MTKRLLLSAAVLAMAFSPALAQTSTPDNNTGIVNCGNTEGSKAQNPNCLDRGTNNGSDNSTTRGGETGSINGNGNGGIGIDNGLNPNKGGSGNGGSGNGGLGSGGNGGSKGGSGGGNGGSGSGNGG